MSKRAMLLCAVSLLTCIYLIGRIDSAQAQKTSATDNSTKQKWEYCAITDSSNMNENDFAVGLATIVYFDRSGYREEKVKMPGEKVGTPYNGEYQRAQKKALATTLAQLGSQGWEMVGQLPYNGYFRSGVEEPTALYFKRVKE